MKNEDLMYKQAFYELPPCMVGALPGDEKTIADLIHYCNIQLDLCESGEDGTEEDDPDAIRKWLKKWDKPSVRGKDK